ncbi:MAG: hypothetical protein [Cystoviridae sp.]|nr:MAG: hypothetical protein [Cystoviridae sp.]
MKFKKALSVVGVGLLAVSMAGCSSNSSESKSSGNETKTTHPKKKKTEQKNTFRKNYDKIKVGDVAQQGNGGTSIDEVTALLGQPTSTSTTKVSGFKVKSYNWTKSDTSILVQFAHKRAITKTISGFKWDRTSKKLDLKAFNKVKDDSSYESLVKSFGEPDGLNENVIMGQTNVTAVYMTGIKGKEGANATFVFDNNKLTSKAQTDLK